MPDAVTAETPIENVSLNALLALQTLALSNLASAKAQVAEVAGELQRRFADSAKTALKEADKTHGTTSLPLQDGLVAKAEVKKEVKWDSAKLQAVAQTLPWERVAAIFKIEFSVSETIYKGIAAAAPDLQTKIDEARTVIFKEPAIALAKAG